MIVFSNIVIADAESDTKQSVKKVKKLVDKAFQVRYD